jgi:hypothetical protein
MWLKHVAAAVKLVPDAASQLAPVVAAPAVQPVQLQLLAPPAVQPAVVQLADAVQLWLLQQLPQQPLLSLQSKALRSQPRDSSRPLVLSGFDRIASCDCFMKQACFDFRNKPVSL